MKLPSFAGELDQLIASLFIIRANGDPEKRGRGRRRISKSNFRTFKSRNYEGNSRYGVGTPPGIGWRKKRADCGMLNTKLRTFFFNKNSTMDHWYQEEGMIHAVETESDESLDLRPIDPDLVPVMDYLSLIHI